MRKGISRRRFVAGSAAAAAGLAAPAIVSRRVSAADQGVIRVAYVGALTGPLAGWGLPGYYGCQVLVDWYNAAGGIKVGDETYTLEMVAYDDEFDPAKALAGAKKVLLEDEVSFIVASYGSPARAMQAFLTENEMVSTTLVQYDTSPESPYLLALTEPFPYENFAGGTWFVKNYPEVKKVAIACQNDEVGLYAIASFNAIFESVGMEVVEQKIFGTDTVDFAPIVASMIAAKPDVLCWGTAWPDFINLMCEQAYLQGWKGQLLATTLDNYWQVIEKTSVEFVEGYVHSYADFDDPRLQESDVPFPEPARFYTESEERWPGSWNAVSMLYPANLVAWKAAVEAGGSYNPMEMLESMRGLDPAPSIFGKGRWRGKDANGIDNSIVGNWPAVQMQNGKAVVVEMVDLNEWLDEHFDLLMKHYEIMGVAKQI